MRRQRSAVVGAGTAGLAAATPLARQSHEVTLIERVTALAPVGAGILLQPSGLAALAELGCLERLLRFGARIDHLHGVSSNRLIMQVPYTDLRSPTQVHGPGVHRGALSHVLESALQEVAHRRWSGCEVQALQSRADDVVATSPVALRPTERSSMRPWWPMAAAARCSRTTWCGTTAAVPGVRCGPSAPGLPVMHSSIGAARISATADRNS